MLDLKSLFAMRRIVQIFGALNAAQTHLSGLFQQQASNQAGVVLVGVTRVQAVLRQIVPHVQAEIERFH